MTITWQATPPRGDRIQRFRSSGSRCRSRTKRRRSGLTLPGVSNLRSYLHRWSYISVILPRERSENSVLRGADQAGKSHEKALLSAGIGVYVPLRLVGPRDRVRWLPECPNPCLEQSTET